MSLQHVKWNSSIQGIGAGEISQVSRDVISEYVKSGALTEDAHKLVKRLVDVTGLEPATPCLQSRCSRIPAVSCRCHANSDEWRQMIMKTEKRR